jgi:hypothetical protein
MPRCSVKKLFKAIDKDGSDTITLSEVKKAFNKAAGKRKSLTYKKLKRACTKYAGNTSCYITLDCAPNEYCNYGTCKGSAPIDHYYFGNDELDDMF